MPNKKQVVYVLGSAFSGSTIFGFLLGTFHPYVNLGEIINISHDYNPKSICSCGSRLEDCQFYNKSITRFNELGFSYTRKRQLFDNRGWSWKKFYLLIGLPNKFLYKKEELKKYLEWNVHFFISHSDENQTVIDLSKSSERLELLKSDSRLEIRTIHLTRPISEVYYSNIKRPKKTRSFLPFKKIREAIYVNLRFSAELKTAQKTNAFSFSYQSISDLNEDTWLALFNYLNVNTINNRKLLQDIIEKRNVDISKQHVFVGNRWIKSYSGKSVKIESRNNSNSTQSADRIIRIVTFLFGHSKYLN
jgi:hypothetical protein